MNSTIFTFVIIAYFVNGYIIATTYAGIVRNTNEEYDRKTMIYIGLLLMVIWPLLFVFYFISELIDKIMGSN